MKTTILFVASLIFSAAAIADDTPRLALWLTDSIGASSGDKCDLTTSQIDASGLLATKPILTESDVVAWNRETGRSTLNPVRFSSTDEQTLQDHCFVLAVDGKPISSGMLLSSHSARLTGFPTISIISHNNALDLQLTSGNHGNHMRLLHVDALDAVLRQKARPQQ